MATRTETGEQDKAKSLSLIKAVKILRCFTHETPERSLAEIVSMTGMPRTICHRLLATLVDEGLAHRSSSTGKYCLTMALFAMGSTALGIRSLSTAASHAMSHLSAQTRDTVLLIVEHEGLGMCIARVDGDYPIQQSALTVGRSWPLHVGGAPFCLLSFIDDARREEILSKPLASLTERTVTDRRLIQDRVAAVRRRGYAVGNEDALDYLVAIGAPIFDHTGRVTAALSVGGLAQRYPNERVDEVAKLAREAALEISLRLGFQPDTDARTGHQNASASTLAPAIQ